MNIKSVSAAITALEAKAKSDVKDVKTDASHKDRDGNGRQEREEAPRKFRLTDEEINRVLNYLRELPGIKNNNLVVRLDSSSATRVVYIQDLKGNVIRRIPEPELSLLSQDQDKKTGQIFDKAM